MKQENTELYGQGTGDGDGTLVAGVVHGSGFAWGSGIGQGTSNGMGGGSGCGHDRGYFLCHGLGSETRVMQGSGDGHGTMC